LDLESCRRFLRRRIIHNATTRRRLKEPVSSVARELWFSGARLRSSSIEFLDFAKNARTNTSVELQSFFEKDQYAERFILLPESRRSRFKRSSNATETTLPRL
jgi:hypothetical protein